MLDAKGIRAEIERYGSATIFVPERPLRPTDLPAYEGQSANRLPDPGP